MSGDGRKFSARWEFKLIFQEVNFCEAHDCMSTMDKYKNHKLFAIFSKKKLQYWQLIMQKDTDINDFYWEVETLPN